MSFASICSSSFSASAQDVKSSLLIAAANPFKIETAFSSLGEKEYTSPLRATVYTSPSPRAATLMSAWLNALRVIWRVSVIVSCVVGFMVEDIMVPAESAVPSRPVQWMG